jgi:hypothetical protein
MSSRIGQLLWTVDMSNRLGPGLYLTVQTLGDALRQQEEKGITQGSCSMFALALAFCR